MANVLIYNTENNRALQYLKSVDTPAYLGRNDVLVNPDLTPVIAIPFKWWQVDAGLVREMTQGEKDALAVEELSAQRTAENAAIDQARISDLETKSVVAVLNVDKPKPIL